jgi:hypothetical protein
MPAKKAPPPKRKVASSTSGKTAAENREDRGLPPGVRPEVKAINLSLVGHGASGNEKLASRVEEAMNKAFEAAQQRGVTDPSELLQAKLDARKAVLDDL